jgi:hypothetical protein
MRDHIRREGAQEISAAWFVIPMSLAAAVLMAMGSEPQAPEPPAAAPLQQATPALPAPATAQPDGPRPEATDHVHTF